MSMTGCWIETLAKPQDYAPKQLDLACQVAHILDRGRLVLVEPPAR